MKELMEIDTYNELREALGNELRSQKQGFVRTGYLLKVARDTDVLQESGYSSVAEFAKAEYGLEKDTVSRYIAINDKYSEGGYSDKLKEKYMDFGLAKLQEMLTLPEPVTDLLTPDISKRQLQELKKEIRAEEQITDLEVMMEEQEKGQQDMSLPEQVLYLYFRENRQQYVALSERLAAIRGMDALAGKIRRAAEEILNILAPSGHNILSARISGVGKMLLSIQGADNPVELLNVRSGEKETISWGGLYNMLESLMSANPGEAGWETVYGTAYEKEQEAEEVSQKDAFSANDTEEEVETAEVGGEELSQSVDIVENDTETMEPAVEVIESPGENQEVAPVQQESATAAVDNEPVTAEEKPAEVDNEPASGENEMTAGLTEQCAEEISRHIEDLKEIMMDDMEQLKQNIDAQQWDLVQMGANNIAAYAEELLELDESQEHDM